MIKSCGYAAVNEHMPEEKELEMEKKPADPADAPAEAGAKPPKRGKPSILRNFVLGLVVGLVVIVIGAAVVFTIGVYKWGWSGKTTGVVLRAVPYPVAMVNNNPIRFSDYLSDIDTLHKFYATVAQTEGVSGSLPTDAEIRKTVMDRLVQNEVLNEAAVKYNLTVTPKEIDDEFAKLSQQRSDTDIAKEISDLYGWTVPQFKEKVMRPYVLQQKLSEALSKDATLNKEAEDKASALLARARAGEDFAQLAKDNSADPGSAADGGELGWFGKGVMVPEFEQAAFSTKKGEITDVVKTEFGYHIIKVEDVKTDKKTGEVTEVKAAHILIPLANVDQYLQDLVAKANIKYFVKEQ